MVLRLHILLLVNEEWRLQRLFIYIFFLNHENDMNGYFRRFSKLPNGTMENRRTSTMASRRIPSMERGRIHLFSMEDGRIPSFNAFLTKNVISVHFTYGTQISWHSEQLSPLYQHIFIYLVYSSLPGLRKIHTQPKEK